MELIPAAAISSSALDAERARMEITANNLANVQSTGKNGQVYSRRIPVFEAVYSEQFGHDGIQNLAGVKMKDIVADPRQPLELYAPYHPSADQKTGMVKMPNISPIEEMVDMIAATRAYEANLSVIKQSRDIADKTITLGRQ
ncbi:MAG: flagellar basal body rod protein FlgC [Lentisphaerae bacterium GWF2_52_8]|nr:MAG: flagellar basal body rod protein FlgC [Lentisphaerae bacterium GWF2_52_8]